MRLPGCVPARLVPANHVGLDAASLRQGHREKLEADDVDGGVLGRHESRLGADLTESADDVRKVAGIRLGRVSDVTPNDPDFGQSAEEIVRYWCQRSGIPYLGAADIGHDRENKVVPFGAR